MLEQSTWLFEQRNAATDLFCYFFIGFAILPDDNLSYLIDWITFNGLQNLLKQESGKVTLFYTSNGQQTDGSSNISTNKTEEQWIRWKAASGCQTSGKLWSYETSSITNTCRVINCWQKISLWKGCGISLTWLRLKLKIFWQLWQQGSKVCN